jgi:hypothetical protein
MEHLADTNILLRSIDQTHPMHVDATTAFSLLTYNGPDFTRYPGIHVVHPSDLAKAANP